MASGDHLLRRSNRAVGAAGREDVNLPAKVDLSYRGVGHFAEYIAPDFRVDYMVFVSNQPGPNRIGVYGFGAYGGSVPSEADRGGAASLRWACRRAASEGRIRGRAGGEAPGSAASPCL